jgi:hypothetical protein
MGEHNVCIYAIRTGVKLVINECDFLLLFGVQEFLVVGFDFGVFLVGAPGGRTVAIVLASLLVRSRGWVGFSSAVGFGGLGRRGFVVRSRQLGCGILERD